MSPLDRVPPPSQELLDALLTGVREARSRLEDRRAEPSTAVANASVSGARRELLAALESYADALRCAGRPVPYRVRDQLQLYRRLDLTR
jgi:hypothetical protein